jgi:hypothetical protein
VRVTPAVCDTSHRPDWPALLEQAAAIVRSYDKPVTLRQLFYRLGSGASAHSDLGRASLGCTQII